jgi:hypothetical protein
MTRVRPAALFLFASKLLDGTHWCFRRNDDHLCDEEDYRWAEALSWLVEEVCCDSAGMRTIIEMCGIRHEFSTHSKQTKGGIDQDCSRK